MDNRFSKSSSIEDLALESGGMNRIRGGPYTDLELVSRFDASFESSTKVRSNKEQVSVRPRR